MRDETLGSAPGYLDYARRVLRTARIALADGDWISAINRAYYAIFYAANALLESKGLERSKHSGVLSLFRREYIKTGLIETAYSDIFGQAYEARNESDYDRSAFPEQSDAEIAVADAERFVARIENYLSEKE